MARLLLPLFFLSGASGLVYQVTWGRQLDLVFGTSQLAIVTVLAAFMGGLAIGGLAASRLADRVRRPLALYGAIELGVGAYAAFFPVLLRSEMPLYLWFNGLVGPGSWFSGIFQAALVGALLLVPTTLMGATLPLLARFATDRTGRAGERVGLLYGVNTLGAVFGVATAGFGMLPAFGVRATTAVAVGANMVLGLSALLLSARVAEGRHVVRAVADAVEPVHGGRRILVVAGLAGFGALVCEVAWTRLMELVLGGSAYAFSAMLVAFLAGIAAGGQLGGRAADRLLARWGRSSTVVGLASLQLGVGALGLAMMYAYQALPFLYVDLYDLVGGRVGPLWVGQVLLACAVMTPPAVLMGATFPFVVRALVGGGRSEIGGPVGMSFAANTLGGIAGAVLAGFVLLPVLDIAGAVRVAVLVHCAACLLALSVAGKVVRRRRSLAVLAVVAVVAMARPPWNPLLMTAGMYKYVSHFSDHDREGVLDYAVRRYDLLYYDEGLSSVVTVAQSRASGNIWLANNGKIDASTTADMPTQVLVGHLPFLFRSDPRDVLVIGLASGITLGSVTLHPEPSSIEVVELEPGIIEASRFFEDYNHRPLEDPRVRVVTNDGRNHLLLAPERHYDVIISEPSNPWLTGVANLFTREFFELGRSRLSPGGVWSQWVQLYGMDTGDLRSLLRAFTDVFPHVALFSTIEDADLVLVGSDRPLSPDPAAAAHLLAREPVAAELRAVGVKSPYDLLALMQMGEDELRQVEGDEPPNTDDNMRVEFSAPLHLHGETAEANTLALMRHKRSLEFQDPENAVQMARAYARREDWLRALICLRRLARPGDPEVARLAVAYRRKLVEELAE